MKKKTSSKELVFYFLYKVGDSAVAAMAGDYL